MMNSWIKFILVIIIAAIQLQTIKATPGNEDGDDEDEKHSPRKDLNLTMAWIEKPPYATSPTNGSLDDEAHGMIRDVLSRFIVRECGIIEGVNYHVKTFRAESEFHMIELLRQNKVHVATPIFEPTNRRYNEFSFFKITDYPGSEFITSDDETNKLKLVLDAVLKSWSLFAVTLILTAIAGVIMWALDTYWNSEEFPRSFIRGSWDGFWWSFISMTTVGYGDKAPKSIVARIFSIIWIMLGLVIMAIFIANITSALTALSLQVEPTDLVGVKVAVLANGTEYKHALKENANPIAYPQIDDLIQAVKSKEVDGLLLDRFTASYYQSRGKLTSLIAVKRLELQRDTGVLFSKDREDLAKCLLNFHRSDILKSAQTFTDSYKVVFINKLTEQRPARNVDLFDASSPFINQFMYVSLGVLAGLLLIGTLCDILFRKKRRIKQNTVLAFSEGMTADTIQTDLEVARRLLRQTQEQFDKLEFKVSKLKHHFSPSVDITDET